MKRPGVWREVRDYVEGWKIEIVHCPNGRCFGVAIDPDGIRRVGVDIAQTTPWLAEKAAYDLADRLMDAGGPLEVA